jgi:hypothetical protein
MNAEAPSGWSAHDIGGTSTTGAARPVSKSYPFVAGPVQGGEGGGAAPAPAPQPDPDPTPAPQPDGDGIAINAGGKATGGFAADSHFSGGKTYSTGAAIANTANDAVYQTERFGDFSYSVPVENGKHSVTLKFAEIYFGAAGQRVFDVKAEGKLVLDNFDVFQFAGGKNVARDKVLSVNVADGDLDLQFISVKNNAKVSGIEIEEASAATAAAFELDAINDADSLI